MKLTSFSVTNYRSITSAHKITLSNVTVLVGRNNEGKSNLLKALEAAMSLLQRHADRDTRLPRVRRYFDYDEIYSWSRDFPLQLQERRSAKHTIVKLEFQLNDSELESFASEIGSHLNGLLALEMKLGIGQEPQFRVVKSGRGTQALTQKSAQIAKFIATRIYFNYIPAVRTEKDTLELIGKLLSQELRTLEKEESYKQALSTISSLQRPILDRLANQVQTALQTFLPNINSVRIDISESNRRFSFRQDFSVTIDDGAPTNIEQKGDGVKSLAALALLQNQMVRPGASILAIEEPESHLHPSAIHQVNEIIRSIAQNAQVIITTHNPLFVDRENLKCNILVTDGGATSAKNINMIRDLLGIKASDNLTNANYALVVEGEEDKIALRAMLSALSEKLAKALRTNVMVIEPIGGAGNLSYKLSLLNTSLCSAHTLLDNDTAGNNAYVKAVRDGLISVASCTFVKCAGMDESEFEDCLNVDNYRAEILDEFGVNLLMPTFRGNKKWSQRLRDTFVAQGKPFSDEILKHAKTIVAKSVERNPTTALQVRKRSSIDALVASLERLVKP